MQTLKWITTGTFALSLSVLGIAFETAASPTHQGEATTSAPTALSEWSAQVWNAAKADDFAQVDSLLESVPPGESDALIAINRSIQQRAQHRIENEATRLIDLAKRQADFATAMAASEINLAMVHAINMKYLMSPNDWRTWLDSAQGQALDEAANAATDRANKDGDLLLAQEVLFRQKALHDGADTDDYKRLDSAFDELNRRVTLIVEFAPREFYRLRKMQLKRLEATAKAEGKDIPEADAEEPEYNELFADDWKERIRGITPKLVLMGLRQAASEHVTNAGWKPLMEGGLGSVGLLLDTPQLVENFPALADPAKVQALRAQIESSMKQVDLTTKILGPADYQVVMNEVLAVNEQAGIFPTEVILREFGEGATSQLSKEYEDDYSEIIWPDNLRRFQQSIQGNFVGVGILLRHNEKRELLIVNPLEGSPASRAGIRPGDRIVAVDEQPTIGWTTNRAVENITGKVGTTVKLTVKRNDVAEPLDFPLKRASIKMRSVNGWWKSELDARGNPKWDWWVDQVVGIGYVRLTSFNEDSFDDFMDAIRQMKKERKLNGLVLDLRGNPGGLLKSAVAFVNLFVPTGSVVSVQDRDGKMVNNFVAERHRSSLEGLPLVVLVNGNSASASEIVAGSLQAHGVAVVLGERSFGKGSVQTVMPLQDGPNEAAVKVTVQYYVLPPIEGAEKGRLVHRRASSEDWGVNPDMVVKNTPPQAEKSGEMRVTLDRLDEASVGQIGVDLRPLVGDLIATGIDPQLETAVMILEARLAGDLETRHLAQVQEKRDALKPAPQ